VVITLGAVIRGDTPHFDVVVAEASKGIATVARETGVPVIFGVLTTDTMQQATGAGWHQEQLGLELWLGGTRDGQLDGGVGPGVRLPDFLGIGTQKGGPPICMGCCSSTRRCSWPTQRNFIIFRCTMETAWSGTHSIAPKLQQSSVVAR
jgi:hypothetical protein